ncbi:MAG: hypothetical protein GQ565_03555 [Candidatus Aegiribacteria sp.]|nr:hypothetical protein [Candidatus Aegiribacteria sp.]
MNSVRFLVSLSVAALFISCGDGREVAYEQYDETVSLYADKGVYIELTLAAEEFEDTLLYRNEMPVELIVSSVNCVSCITAMLVPGCGSTPADRTEYLSGGDLQNLDTNFVKPHGDIPGFTAVVYLKGDSSVVERVWNRGSGELAVLQVKSEYTSLNILLTSVAGILRTSEIVDPSISLSRSVYLSDRGRSEIVEEVNADVTVPPAVIHRIKLSVDPMGRGMHVLDSLIIDFRPTQSDSQLMIYLPYCDNGTSFEVLSGSAEHLEDSVLCTADSSRIFSGLYSGRWNGFISSSTDRITEDGLHINPSTSFQSGMWFYPGCGVPSAYTFDISIPDMGYEVFAPLQEVSRNVDDSLLTVSYISPIEGIKGPLSWATGGFTENAIADGRSRYICLESDSTALGMIDLADDIAEVLWRNMAYDGARLDFVVVRSLDVPVFITGPGCVFLSTDMLASVRGYETWSDSLARGKAVPATSIVFEAAKAFLAGSTYLSENLRNVLAAWSVYRFALSGDESVSNQLCEAFRKYYLYSTEMNGGTEYAIADPRLNESPLHDPVIFGKAPVVIEFLIHEIPAFERAVPRALRSLRHSGDSFGRLFSAMGIPESSGYGEMFFQWLYSPGVPQLEISWTADSADTLCIRVEQLQPGQDFPLGSILDEVRIHTATGFIDLDLSPGSMEGLYLGDISAATETILAVDIDPDGILPADIIYRHINNEPNNI